MQKALFSSDQPFLVRNACFQTVFLHGFLVKKTVGKGFLQSEVFLAKFPFWKGAVRGEVLGEICGEVFREVLGFSLRVNLEQ